MSPKQQSQSASVAPLYGLVLTGGASSRMNQDKAALVYHQQPQAQHCFTLLSSVCDKVFLSNREAQTDAPGHAGLPQIHDQYTDIGPLGGVLSAMSRYPEAAWLVLACDMPFVTVNHLAQLVQHRDPAKLATVFYNYRANIPEPLCTIYEPQSQKLLLGAMLGEQFSLTGILGNTDNITLIEPEDTRFLININTPEEYETLLQQLNTPEKPVKA